MTVRRELMAVGLLLAVMTPYTLWQFRFGPNAIWQRLEFQRKKTETARGFNVSAAAERYSSFIQGFPNNPNTVAARVVLSVLEERMDPRSQRALKILSGISRFEGDRRAALEVRKLLQDPVYKNIAEEVLWSIEPRRLPLGRVADTLMVKKSGEIVALDSETGKTIPLLRLSGRDFVTGSQTWRHDLERVAFATSHAEFKLIEPPPNDSRRDRMVHFNVRWTVWMADLKAGYVRALLPSEPMPDLTKISKPLLQWSKDGSRLWCIGESFLIG